jgi:hypothetical protein
MSNMPFAKFLYFKDIMLNLKQIATFAGLIITLPLISTQPASAQRICIVTDAGKVECGRFQENSTPRKSQTIEFADLALTLEDCKRYLSTVKCNFFVTTKKDGDTWLSIGRVFDSYGGDYTSSTTQIGQEIYFTGSGGVGGASTQLLTGIPLKAILTFKEIPKQVKELAALQVNVSRSERNKAIFRNVIVSE